MGAEVDIGGDDDAEEGASKGAPYRVLVTAAFTVAHAPHRTP